MYKKKLTIEDLHAAKDNEFVLISEAGENARGRIEFNPLLQRYRILDRNGDEVFKDSRSQEVLNYWNTM